MDDNNIIISRISNIGNIVHLSTIYIIPTAAPWPLNTSIGLHDQHLPQTPEAFFFVHLRVSLIHVEAVPEH